MSLFSSNHINPQNILQINQDKTHRNIYLDVTPLRTPHIPSLAPNHKEPPTLNNFIEVSFSKDIIFQSIIPVLRVLKVFGVLPISKNSSDRINYFSINSVQMFYSVAIIVALVSYVFFFAIYRVEIAKSVEGKFEEAVIEYLFTVYLFPVLVVPILWYETGKITKLLNSWADFEITFQRVAGKPIQIGLYKKALLISIIVPTVSALSVCVTHITMAHFKPLHVIPYVFLEVMTYLLGGYWYLLCECLSQAANILSDDFYKVLRHIGPAGRVGGYRALWLRLSKLARDTGIAHSYSFTFLCLYLFSIITLSIYGLMSQISDGFGVKDIGLAVTACFSVTLLFFICDEAHYASYNVRTTFQKRLLTAELSWMNADAQTEVNMFLRATEMNPSHISLGGFFDVNRNLFKSLLATMVTYLVVLLQFQISIPEDTSVNSLNSTIMNRTTNT